MFMSTVHQEEKTKAMRFKVWIELLSLLLIVIGALNWGLIGLFKFNVVAWLAKRTFKSLEPIVYILVGLAAVLNVLSRDYYLTFLGPAAFPCGSLVERVPEKADTEVDVFVAPNVNVIYWAAEPNSDASKPKPSPWIAYDQYANAGVVRSDATGKATLKFRNPASYNVPWRGTIPAHVHYRVCSMSGMMSRVETIKLS
jgi:uncharacterized membrane protein YuzA (DUF378 family)